MGNIDTDMLAMYRPQPLPLDCPDGEASRCDVTMTPFLYCVCVPVAVMAVFLVVLIFVMCCSRKACQCKKYSALTSEANDIQMDSYNTIRRASATLRYMSSSQCGAADMGSRAGSSATLDRSSYRRARRGREACHSAPGTLQRQHRNRHSTLDDPAPSSPPPPPYSMHSDDLAFGSEFLPGADMQTSVQSDYNPERNGNGAQPLLYRHHQH